MIEPLTGTVSDGVLIDDIVNTDRYPLASPESAAWTAAVERAQHGLRDDGCSVLRDFVRPLMLDRLRDEGDRVVDHAYYDVTTVNVYNTDPDPELPEDHPGRLPMKRGNAFVPRDRIPSSSLIDRLYTSELFQRFLAACLQVPRIHPLDDPLAGLCLNIVAPGRGHPWHFDTNEFAVSLLTREPEAGGVFEYCPNIRRAGAENLSDVRAVLTGDGDHLIRRLTLRPGDLQLFRGRFSLHRVTRVDGTAPRHTAILSYSEQPGVVGRAARTRQLFGRLTSAHQDGSTTRGDQLLD